MITMIYLIATAFLVLMGLHPTASCIPECTCSLEVTTCFFEGEIGTDCKGSVPYEETYALYIYGKVCPTIRDQLKLMAYANTIKILYNDECGDIPNCRLCN